ncbi:MAG TPA: hypothetical protein VGN20_19370 [Mucilaginibacter sp.]|jgi:peptidoglycan/LPS O-acetylase OafA/YrhL
MAKDKILSIQYLRGLAALGVVFCHFGSDISAVFNFGQTGVYVCKWQSLENKKPIKD